MPYSLGAVNAGVAGTVKAALDLASGFSGRGHGVNLFAKPSPNQPAAETWKGVHLNRLRSPSVPVRLNRMISSQVDFYYVPLLLRNIEDGPDRLIAFNDPWPCTLPRASFRVFSLHFQKPHMVPRVKFLQRLANVDLAICPSRFFAEQLERHAPALSRRVTYVYNGIDTAPFENADRQSFRKRLGITENEIVIMYAGQINELKGLAYLVRALKDLRTDHSNVSLLVIGSPRIWPDYNVGMVRKATAYERQVALEATGLPVRFAGQVPEMDKPGYFAACDIYCCPSVLPEGFPLTILEAMASGKPVVATSVGGIPEEVVEGETGMLVSPADSNALAKALKILVKDEETRQRMGANAKALTKRKFTMDRMLDGYLQAGN